MRLVEIRATQIGCQQFGVVEAAGVEIGPAQTSPRQIGAPQLGTEEIRADRVDADEPGAAEDRPLNRRETKACAGKVRLAEARAIEGALGEARTIELRAMKAGVAADRSGELGTAELGAPDEGASRQVCVGEVALRRPDFDERAAEDARSSKRGLLDRQIDELGPLEIGAIPDRATERSLQEDDLAKLRPG